jgi:glycosyltransferase involved in cell wall biosynthesis
MRIAVVETANTGGLLHYAAQLADGLARNGHAVDLLVPARNELAAGGQAAPGDAAGARVRAVLVPAVRSAPPAGGRPLRKHLRRGMIAQRHARSLLRVLWEVRARRYDVVLVQWEVLFWLFSAASHLLLSLPRRPRVVFVLHNVRPFDRWGGEGVYLENPRVVARMRRLLPRFDLVVLHGERSREEYLRTWPATRLAVVPHGDERLFAGAPPEPSREANALFFGGWHTVKGLPLLMEAFDDVARRLPEATLTIAGAPAPGDFDDELVRRWAASHGSRVRLVPHYVPVEDVPALFAGARVVVTPYLAGYQSGVVHLAMTMARAVVTSDVGDLPSVVLHDRTGMVVPRGDAAALAEALVRVLSDAALAQRLGAAGAERMTALADWEEVGRQLAEALTPLLEGGSRTDGR